MGCRDLHSNQYLHTVDCNPDTMWKPILDHTSADWENPVQVTLPQEAAKLTESADPVWQWVMQTLEYSLHHKLIEQENKQLYVASTAGS